MATSETGSCSHKDDRVEIDMRAPFESVKDVVSLFAERAAWNSIRKGDNGKISHLCFVFVIRLALDATTITV